MAACVKCGLAVCACRTGRTRLTVGGSSVDEAIARGQDFLRRRGWTGEALRTRPRRTPTAVYMQAWEIEYAVDRAEGTQ
jgi:hypothetical protein